MRVVLDTNVIIAAFAARGLCCDVYETCLNNHTMVVGSGILKEVRKALAKKVKLPTDSIDRIMGFIEMTCENVVPVEIENGICRDVSDLHVIGTAVAGRVDCLVTGDPDLLILKKYQWIEILSPRAFWDKLSRQS